MKNAPPDRLSVLLLSDSTGETIRAAAKAAFSQFDGLDITYDVHAFIRSRAHVDALGAQVFRNASILAFTVVDPQTKDRILALAAEHGLPCVSVLDPLLDGIARVLRRPPSTRPGGQYQVDNSYLDRVAAIDYAIAHDDGMSEEYLRGADVILTGVSRTSKTPTCIYLGYQGIKAANVPLILGQPPRPELLAAMEAGVPVVGLTASPGRLIQVRQTRLRALGNPKAEQYSDRARIEEELVAARLFFERHSLPVIDVTRRSIEETAASIRQLIARPTR